MHCSPQPVHVLEEVRALDLVRSADGSRIAGRGAAGPAAGRVRARSGRRDGARHRRRRRACTASPRPRWKRPATAWRWLSRGRHDGGHGDVSVPSHGLAGRRQPHDRDGARGRPARGRRHRSPTPLASATWSATTRGEMERSTRDVVSRSSYMEIVAGRGTPQGGVTIDVSHLGADVVQQSSPAWSSAAQTSATTCADDRWKSPRPRTSTWVASGLTSECRTDLPGLLAAGEDAGGVHGSNRLGGNGVAESTVFGAIAGEVAAREAAAFQQRSWTRPRLQISNGGRYSHWIGRRRLARTRLRFAPAWKP